MTAPDVPLEARPVLASKARLRTDRTTGETLLIYPERGLKLNPTGEAVLRLCTGALSVAEIAAALATQHGGDPDRVLAEVRGFLGQLAARGLLRGV